MLDDAKNAVIVGGSLGGLFAGIILKRAGLNVHILERANDKTLLGQGAGIMASKGTIGFFSENDHSNLSIGKTTAKVQTLNKDGEYVSTDEQPLTLSSYDLLYHRLRASFDGLESQYCDVPDGSITDGKVIYDYGKTVTDVTESGNKMKVVYTDNAGLEGVLTVDLVIAADGASSTIRKILDPTVERRYAGYVAWRGTISEKDVSPLTHETLANRTISFFGLNTQVILYHIPGRGGSVKDGEGYLNYVWYDNLPKSSPEYAEVMTDSTGLRHRITVPPGLIADAVQARQLKRAEENLPPQIVEIFSKAAGFLQLVTDVPVNKSSHFGGKVLLIGDALAGFRPHTFASTGQAAYDAMLIGKLLAGNITLEEWELDVETNARRTQEYGVRLGNLSQFDETRTKDDYLKLLGEYLSGVVF